MFGRQVFSVVWDVVRILPLVVFLSACMSGDNSNSDTRFAGAAGVPTLVQGYVVKGPVANSAVRVYKVNANGSRGALVAGPFITDASGFWSGNVPHSSEPYEVVSVGGSYTDEASGSRITRLNNDSDSLSGILDFSASSMVVVTPFTAAVLHAAKSRAVSDRVTIDVAIRSAVFDLQSAFGFDLTTVVPTFTEVPPEDLVGTDGEKYAVLLGGFSSLLHNNPALSALNNLPVHQVRDALISDLADGHLDGRGATANSVRLALANGSFVNFPELSSEGISALIAASNSYALAQAGLAHVGLDVNTVLAFGAEGGRLLRGGVEVAMVGGGYLMFRESRNAEPEFTRQAVLSFDETNTLIDETGNRLMTYVADSNYLPTESVWHLTVDERLIYLHSIEINSKGIITAVSKTGLKRHVGRIILATFQDEAALEEYSPGRWAATQASGAPVIITAGGGSGGTISFVKP